MPSEERPCTVRSLTQGPRAHFLGHGQGSPWDASGRRLLALAAEADNRMPLPGEKAAILLIDVQKGLGQPLAETAAWNWQLGCCLQWLPPGRNREIIYNDVADDQHVAVILNIQTGARRVLPRPIGSVSPDGRTALSFNLARLMHLRPWQEYAGVRDPFVSEFEPREDGIWSLDLRSGQSRLLVSVFDAAHCQPKPNMDDVKHRFDAVAFNAAGARFLFLQRWSRLIGGRPYNERLWTANADGTELHVVADEDFVPYFTWVDDTRILAWAAQEREHERYWLFTDRTREKLPIGGTHLSEGGHVSFAPNRHWLAADTQPDARSNRHLLLYEPAADRRINLASFSTPPPFLRGDLRCDLHPRWSPDGQQLCFESAHEGVRQVYLAEAGQIIAPAAGPAPDAPA